MGDQRAGLLRVFEERCYRPLDEGAGERVVDVLKAELARIDALREALGQPPDPELTSLLSEL